MRRRRREPFAWYAGLKQELIRRTAYVALFFRLIEVIAGWILFRQSFAAASGRPDAAQLVFVGYGVANVVLCAWYRTRRASRPVVLTDLGINLTGTVWMAALTGGARSPIVLIGFVKIAAYGVLFSPGLGSFAFMTTLASLMPLFATEFLLPHAAMPGVNWPTAVQHSVNLTFQATALSAILIGTAWLFDELGRKEREVTAEAARATEAAQREHAAAAVTGALLAVSDAVSRLSRPDEVLNKVVEVAPRVLAVNYCAVLLWHEDSNTYRSAALGGVDPVLAERAAAVPLAPEEAPDLEWVRRLGHCAVVNAVGLTRLGVPHAPTILMAPLLSGGHFYGVIQFARRGGQNSFTQRDLAIADGIASQTAIALERARLVDESRRLVRAVESTTEAVVITDPEGRAVFANQAFANLYGAARERILGRTVLAEALEVPLTAPVPDGRSLLEQNWQGETRLRRPAGDLPTDTAIPVHVTVSVIRDLSGQTQGTVTILQDVSAEKELQRQLQRADRLAAAGELAAGVAHEVNNALVSILAQAERARESADAAGLRDALLRVETHGHRIADIVQRLLRFARPPTPQRGPVDLLALVRDTIQLMSHDLDRARVRSELLAPASLPLVVADAKLVQQVLVNLFTNAAQAMQPAGGTLRVTAKTLQNWVAVEVHDTGVGIPADDLPRIFDPFFSTKEKGTGLGLSVSDAIVNAHGGELLVQSTPGRGTVFTLRLPTTGVSVAAHIRTALVVDDDDAVAATLMAMLSRDGLSVERASTGTEALATLHNATFDAVFLDLRLPDLSGEEVYARLAADLPAVAQRVIFVTGGLWRPEGGGLRDRLPPQPTLSKPCTLAQIRDALSRLAEQCAA